MLTLTFLGVGSAFARRNYNSNALIEAWSTGPEHQQTPDENLLIDFGITGPFALHALKEQPEFHYLRQNDRINYRAIQQVLITHLHSDHIGGIEQLAYCSLPPTRNHNANISDYSEQPPRKTVLYSSDEMLERLWTCSLRGGLSVLNGRVAQLDDYFKPIALPIGIDKTATTLLNRYQLSIFRTDHVRLHERFDWDSFGLMITDVQSNQTALFSGDTRHDPETFGPLLEHASISFHEICIDQPDNPVHTNLDQLMTWPETIRQKIRLYHYGDNWDEPEFSNVEQNFAGWAQPQKRYVLFSDS